MPLPGYSLELITPTNAAAVSLSFPTLPFNLTLIQDLRCRSPTYNIYPISPVGPRPAKRPRTDVGINILPYGQPVRLESDSALFTQPYDHTTGANIGPHNQYY